MTTDDTISTEADRLRILLIEDNEDDVQLFVDLISDHVSSPIDLALASRLDEAIADIRQDPYDMILLDLSLPDSEGCATYHAVQEAAAGTPIIILTGLDDEALALKSLGEGVQDYLVKGKVDGALLMRAIRYAIERQSLIHKLTEANTKVELLSTMLPLCPSCKKVRTEDGNWTDLERYLREFTQTKVKQTLCPSCGRHLH